MTDHQGAQVQHCKAQFTQDAETELHATFVHKSFDLACE